MAKLKYLVLYLVIGLVSCKQSDMEHYNLLVKKELNSNKRVNDIFFGISLGMTSKEFYIHCWNMNKKGLFTDGSSNTSVLYKLNHKALRHPAEMNFYPEFSDGKIHNMWAKFQYTGWMPGNKELGSDKLLEDILKLYQDWYRGGNSFIKITDQKKGVIYVKVDGNRRIILGVYDDMQVKADYTDLSVK